MREGRGKEGGGEPKKRGSEEGKRRKKRTGEEEVEGSLKSLYRIPFLLVTPHC